jgi:hypothetical protein
MECVWMPWAAELGTEAESPLWVGLKGCTDLERMARPVLCALALEGATPK